MRAGHTLLIKSGDLKKILISVGAIHTYQIDCCTKFQESEVTKIVSVHHATVQQTGLLPV